MKMLRLLGICLFCFSASITQYAQESHTGIVPGPPPFKKHLSPAAAFSYSVINNRKEVRGQYKPGVNFGLHYYTRPWFSWSGEFSYFFPHNSSPGLADIHAWNTELNGNLNMTMGESDLKFRCVFGVSYLDWKGTYVGPDLVDNSSWYYGKRIKQNWVAANLGVGFGHAIGKQFDGYMDFRMRFASEKKDLVSISDTAFLVGLRWNPVFSHKPKDTDEENNAKKKTTKSGSKRQYKWLKKRN